MSRATLASSAPPSPTIETAYSWWVAAVTVLISSISFGAVTSSSILLLPIARSLEVGVGSLSLVHASAMAGAGIGSLVLGRLLDRYGFFGIALIGSCATAAGLLFASVTTSLPLLCLSFGILVGGIGQGTFFSPLTANLAHWFDRHRALAIALGTSGQAVGGLLLSPLLRLSAEQFGWRTVFAWYALLGGASLLAGALVFRRKPPVPIQIGSAAMPAAATVAPSTLAAGMPLRRFLMLAGCFTLSNAASFIAIAHLTAFGEEQGFDILIVASLLPAMLGVVLVSRLSFGFLAARFGVWRVLVAMSAIHVAGSLWLAFSTSYHHAVIAAVLLGLGFGGYVPGYALLVRESYPANQSGRRIGQIYFFSFLSAGSGSMLGGWLHDVTGNYAMSFAFAGAASAAGLLLLLLCWQLTRSAPPSCASRPAPIP
ncbi:MFS transporter [Lacisediminimonas sp.]|uniref:MFS transporter n=1 Tax=Lacisediminimonas sp. TaxID=3060582 RepID=UPI0027218877|nr:MFS transporter [Lacisediminimonas sp.]MDO8298748.1 MFS transporter [Lacisediminimonas sp.]